MTVAVGLDRLPRPVARLLGEAAGNLLAVSNRLDELLAGDRAALDAIVRGEGEGDRIVHDLLAVVGASKRDGPGRGPLIELGQAVDDVLDALEDVACCWHARPVDELAVLLLALGTGSARRPMRLRHSSNPIGWRPGWLVAATAATRSGA